MVLDCWSNDHKPTALDNTSHCDVGVYIMAVDDSLMTQSVIVRHISHCHPQNII